MSRRKLQKFESAPLVDKHQRRRASRHGQPHVTRVRTVKTVNDKVTVVYEERPYPSEGVTRRVAAHSTTPGGLENKPENMAPKGKGGAKPAGGAR